MPLDTRLVNGQMSTVYAPLRKNFLPTHQRLQKFKQSGSIEHHKSSSIAAISHEGKSFRRQEFAITTLPAIFWVANASMPLWMPSPNFFLIQRYTGNFAKYFASRKQIFDHDLDAERANSRCGEFHGMSILRGGPTTDRRSRRYATPILRQSLRYTVRCPAAKHASWNEPAAGGAARTPPPATDSDQAHPTFG